MENNVINNVYISKGIIGNNNVSEIYQVQNTNDNHDYIIRKYFSHINDYENLYEKLKLINNKNIVVNVDFFKENGSAYIVQKYVHGKKISDLVENISKNFILVYVCEIVDIMKSLFNNDCKNVLLSLDNIIIQEDNSLIITDFVINNTSNEKDILFYNIKLIRDLLTYNQEIEWSNDIKSVIKKCSEKEYSDYNKLYFDLMCGLKKLLHYNYISMIIKSIMIIFFFLVSINMFLIANNVMFILIGAFLVLLDIFLLYSMENIKFFLKHKIDKYTFDIIKSEVLINTDEII